MRVNLMLSKGKINILANFIESLLDVHSATPPPPPPPLQPQISLP